MKKGKQEKRRIMIMKFYICRHCGNIVTKLTSSKVPLYCCGQPMELLEAGVTDAAVEKHVPVVTVEGGLVKATTIMAVLFFVLAAVLNINF